MFTKPTVFVLGAGVSKPFKFPVGKELKNAICKPTEASPKLLQELLCLSMVCDNQGYFDVATLPYLANDVGRFIESFAGADMYSIDVWLEANQQERKFLNIGKRAIAAIIIDAETRSKNVGAAMEYDWFAWLWNNMWTPDINDLAKNTVKFITFNYDRLFEWKLWQQITHTYLGAPPQQQQDVFAKMLGKIVHVHGAVTASDSVSDFLRDYGDYELSGLKKGSENEIYNKKLQYAKRMHFAAESINIVCEHANDNKLIEAAKCMIDNNSRLVFLGFSFDKRNILKLGLNEFAKQRGTYGVSKVHEKNLDNLPIIGTGMGIMRAERAAIEAMFDNIIALGGEEMDAVAFCRSHVLPE